MTEDRFKELERRIEKLEKENKRLKKKSSVSLEQHLSRRRFLKRIGTGAAVAGALSMIPSASSALSITDNSIFTGSNAFWNAGNDGPGSGLDADTVDGIESSSLQAPASTQNWTASSFLDDARAQSKDQDVEERTTDTVTFTWDHSFPADGMYFSISNEDFQASNFQVYREDTNSWVTLESGPINSASYSNTLAHSEAPISKARVDIYADVGYSVSGGGVVYAVTVKPRVLNLKSHSHNI